MPCCGSRPYFGSSPMVRTAWSFAFLLAHAGGREPPAASQCHRAIPRAYHAKSALRPFSREDHAVSRGHGGVSAIARAYHALANGYGQLSREDQALSRGCAGSTTRRGASLARERPSASPILLPRRLRGRSRGLWLRPTRGRPSASASAATTRLRENSP